MYRSRFWSDTNRKAHVRTSSEALSRWYVKVRPKFRWQHHLKHLEGSFWRRYKHVAPSPLPRTSYFASNLIRGARQSTIDEKKFFFSAPLNHFRSHHFGLKKGKWSYFCPTWPLQCIRKGKYLWKKFFQKNTKPSASWATNSFVALLFPFPQE